jgi:hypothetical protein
MGHITQKEGGGFTPLQRYQLPQRKGYFQGDTYEAMRIFLGYFTYLVDILMKVAQT